MNPNSFVTKIGLSFLHCFFRYGVYKVSLPAVSLIFEILTPKANQHIYELKDIYDQNWVKFPFVF